MRYLVISYIIGNVKYKEVCNQSYDDKKEAVEKYKEILNTFINKKIPTIICLLEIISEHELKIVTCWPLDTPIELIKIQNTALNKYLSGTPVHDNKTDLKNLLGEQIYNETFNP